jgi:choline-sulfatase
MNQNHSSKIHRRRFLQSALTPAIASALGPATLAGSQGKTSLKDKPPNILLIMSDEHNHRVTGCYGNPLVRTPNLDRLAERGVTFEHAYCNSPLCVPSRLSLTSGKYIHRVGAWNNSCWLPSADAPSLPRILNTAGYDSALCGKQHYDYTRRYGFVEIGGNMNRNHKTGRGGRRAADDMSVNVAAGQSRMNDFHPGDDSSIMSHDRKVTAGAVDFLSSRSRGDRPFFLFVGYLAPHFPIIAPEKYWEPYKGRVPMPEIPEGFFDSMPLNYKHLRRGFGLIDVDAGTVRRGRELYYGLTQWIDEEIGKVLDTLQSSPLADNTVVIYTTDHGENMGEHGLWWKNCMYEQAAHVPLIISCPKRWQGGQRRRGACSLLDVAQTVAEIGGARVPDDWNGHSMAPWMDDGASRWKDMAVSQYYAHNIASGFAMLRTGDWKYVYHSPPDSRHPAERELYDLKADPQEFKNLARNAAHRSKVDEMHSLLVKELDEHPDETEQRCRADYARGYGRDEESKKRTA